MTRPIHRIVSSSKVPFFLTHRRILRYSAEEARAYLTGAVSHCIGVFLLAVLMNSAGLSGWLPGLAAGLAVSLGFMATSRGTNYVYEKRPMALFLINSGYNVVFYAVAGALLGVWH